jgi:hypothetical protein
MLGGPQELVWVLWEREKYLAHARNQTLAIQPAAHFYSELPWLLDMYMYGDMQHVNRGCS